MNRVTIVAVPAENSNLCKGCVFDREICTLETDDILEALDLTNLKGEHDCEGVIFKVENNKS